MGTLYDIDVVAWSMQQAALLRAGRWTQIDLDNIVEEIESVGRAEQREFESRFAQLLTNLLKWCYRPGERSEAERATIDMQRGSIMRQLKKTPSLRHELLNAEWLKDVWDVAVVEAEEQTELEAFPEQPAWKVAQVLAPAFYPESLA